MGRVYVVLDRHVIHQGVEDILGHPIDSDLQVASRYELCRMVEDVFSLPAESFWTLQSTQKIRLSVQLARNLKGEGVTE